MSFPGTNAVVKRIVQYRWHILVVLFFTAVSTAVFAPWFSRPNSVLFAFPGDPFGTVWQIWFSKYAMQNGLPLNFTELIGAPYGYTSGPFVLYFWTIIYWPFNLLFNEIFTYNFLVFISFPLSGIFMYLLAWHVTGNRYASLVAGFIFAFSPYHLMRSLQHLTLAHIQWIPLFFLAVLRLREKRTSLNWALLTLSFGLLLLSDYHYGYFGLIIAVVILTFIFIYNRMQPKEIKVGGQNSRRRWEVSVSVVVIGLAFITLAAFPFIANWSKVKSTGYKQIEQLYVYSARPLEYLMPSIDNPVFGSFVENISSQKLHNSNFVEQTIYLGFIPLILAAIAIFYARNDANERRRFVVYFGLVGAITALLFSAPPTIEFLGISIPMPSYIAHKFVPIVRVYARFAVFVIFFVALLAGIGLTRLLEKIRSGRSKAILIVTILALVAIEFTNVPPWRFVPVTGSAIPKVYHWLAKQPGDIIVAEYPLASSEEYPTTEYLFYQRIHNKRLLNGGYPNSRADRVRQTLVDLEQPSLGEKINKIGIKYLIVHRSRYGEGMILDINKRYFGGSYGAINTIKYNDGKIPVIRSKQIKLFKKFGDDYVYKVENGKD